MCLTRAIARWSSRLTANCLTPNLLPWLALVLRWLGVPVLVHGSLGGAGEAGRAYVFRELGVMPSATFARVQATLQRDSLAFAPDGVLCPGLAKLLAHLSRLGLRNVAQNLAALLDPFHGRGVRIIGLADRAPARNSRNRCVVRMYLTPSYFLLAPTAMRSLIRIVVRVSLLFRMVRDPSCSMQRRAPRQGERIFQSRVTCRLRHDGSAQRSPVRCRLPHPLVNQLACCLFVSRYAVDMCGAKAIAAMQSGISLADSAAMRESGGLVAQRHA
jgi:hypothetical protein